MKVGIVNYITPNGWRPFGQSRLVSSLQAVNCSAHLYPLSSRNFFCPTHRETPYAFKLFALDHLRKDCCDIAIWLDASFWAIKEVESLFQLVCEHGLLVQNSGYPVGMWSSDESLEVLKVKRDDAFSIPMFSGGLIGLDFNNTRVQDFFNTFLAYAKDGRVFRGAWDNRKGQVSVDSRVKGHRHDMVVGSILSNLAGLPIQSNNSLFCYYNWYVMYKKSVKISAYFLIEGGYREI